MNTLCRIVSVASLVVIMASAQTTLAQGTLYVSNLELAPSGQTAVASDYWLAQGFRTGDHPAGYDLNSIQLRMAPGTGSPSGFEVMVLNQTSSLEPLGVIGRLSGPDPGAGGVFSYSSQGIRLSPSSYQFIAVKGATAANEGQYSWSSAARTSWVETDGWGVLQYRYSSADGVTWNRESRADSFQLAIYATPVPEPSVMALAGLGLGMLWFGRRWRGGATEQEVDEDARQRAIDKSLSGVRLPRM
jgi:hypothetical protein